MPTLRPCFSHFTVYPVHQAEGFCTFCYIFIIIPCNSFCQILLLNRYQKYYDRRAYYDASPFGSPLCGLPGKLHVRRGQQTAPYTAGSQPHDHGIEKHYGFKVFERINKRLFLTEHGRQLWNDSERVLKDFGVLEQNAQNSSKISSLQIGCGIAIGTILMPELIMSLHER